MKITKVETFLVKPRWLFLKMHTDEGIVGLGEPILEGRALTCQMVVKELEPWLIGEDPTKVVHLWQSMYKHAFYWGGPILTSALSGIEQALWDCYGKYMGVPVYKLLGGPTRDRIRVYGTANGDTPEAAAQRMREAAGPEVDIAIDFHGAVSPQNAKRLVKALEPYHPFFIEEPVQCQNVDV